jgi:RNA polymerase sigma-70 factor (ECF subfamily)
MDDQALSAALARNLDAAFEQVVLQYQHRLYRFGLRLSGCRSDAEEIVQDAFVRAHQALKGYSPERVRSISLKPWLYQITVNVFRNRIRRRQLQLIAIDVDPRVAGDSEQPERALELSELARGLSALLASLPPRHREAVALRHIEGLSYPEMAVILDQPEGTVKANVHRGLAALHKALNEQKIEARS